MLAAVASCRSLGNQRAYASAAAAAAAASASSKPAAKKKDHHNVPAPTAAATPAVVVDGRGKRPRGVGSAAAGSSKRGASPRPSRSRSPAGARSAAAAAAGAGAAGATSGRRKAPATSSSASSSSSRLYTRENYAKLAASGWDPAAVASVAQEADADGSSNGSNRAAVRALMARLRASATLSELEAAVAAGEASRALDAVAVAAAVTRVPRLLHATASSEQARRERDFALALSQEPAGGGGDESSVSGGSGRRRPGRRPAALLEQQRRDLRESGALPPDASPEDVAAARQAAARAARKDASAAAARLLARLEPALGAHLPSLGAREVCNVLWAVARAQHVPSPALLDAAVAALLRPSDDNEGEQQQQQAIDAAQPQELAMLALAARHLAPGHDALWSAIERRGAEMARAPARGAGGQQQQQQQPLGWFEASSLAWAATKAGRRADVLTPALAEWVVEQQKQRDQDGEEEDDVAPPPPPRVREVTALLWAFAEQGPQALSAAGGGGQDADAALAALCDVVAARLPEVEAPGDLASALWAVGRLGHLHPPLLRRVAEHLRRAPLTAAAGGGEGAPPVVTSGGVSWQPLPGAASASSNGAPATGPAPTARLLAMAAWAAARLMPGSLADVTGGEAAVAGSAGAAKSDEAGEATAAAGSSDPAAALPPPRPSSPHAPLAASLLLPAATALLRSPQLFSPQDSAGVAWAAARLGHRSPDWWRRAAELAVSPRLAEFGAPQLTNVARAYARQAAQSAQSAVPAGLMEGIAKAAERRASEFGAADAAGLLRALAACGGGMRGPGSELAAAARGAGEALVSALQKQQMQPRERKQLAAAAAAVGVADAESVCRLDGGGAA
jgi:hypothetical protein